MLLWALGTKVLEDAATSPGVAQVAISAISQPLLRYHQSKKRWSANTARCGATVTTPPAKAPRTCCLVSSRCVVPLQCLHTVSPCVCLDSAHPLLPSFIRLALPPSP